MHKALARSTACATLAAAAVAVAPVGAQQNQPPTPTSCAGMSFSDPPGDQKVNVVPLSGGIADSIPKPQKAKDNVDLVGGFLRYTPDAGGKNVLTANIIVTDLQPGTESGASALMFTFGWTQEGATRYVQATVDATLKGTYAYGTNSTSGYTKEGDTTGTLYPGKNGVVSIVIPVDKMSMANKTISLTNASAANFYTAGGRGFFPENDGAPDDGAGKSFKVVPCAEAGQPTTPQPVNGGTPPPSEGTPPPQQQQPPPSNQPQQPPAPAGPATLNIQVTAPKLSAKKLKRAKSVRFKLKAGERITDLTATLAKGSKKVASGRLAEINGDGTLKLKRARRAKFKKGTYTLRLSGVTAAGQRADSTVQVRVKK